MLNDILTTYLDEFKSFFTNYSEELALIFVLVFVIIIIRLLFKIK